MQGNDGGGVLRQAHRHDLIRHRHSVADDRGELVSQLIKLRIRQ